MKKHILILIVIQLSNFTFGQTNDFLKNYPFNKSTSIMIGEFIDSEKISDTLWKVTCREIPKINKKVNVAEFENLKKLYSSEYPKLAKIIFENETKISEGIIKEKSYNEFGYAILFFNETGQVFEYIQFCYNSKITYSSFPQSKLKNFDWDKFNLLKQLFKDNGIAITEYRGGD